jgi:hypothetical protein
MLAVAAAPAQARIERVVEKTFVVEPGGTLRVSTGGGKIRVLTSTAAAVKVVAREHIEAASAAEADGILKKLTLTLEQQGSDVAIGSEYEKEQPGFLGWWWPSRSGSSWPPATVDFIVTVPARYSVELNSGGGDVTVGDLEGALHARTGGGSLKIGRISGPIDAATGGGSVTLSEGHSVIRLDTGGGSISANLVGPLQGDCSFKTSGGSVDATVSQGVGFHLDAATSGGRIDTEGLILAIPTRDREESRLSCEVNGGGPLLQLRSGGGGISVAASTAAR